MDEIYVIVNISELDSIDYSQVSQSSSTSVRKSLDKSMFILSYDGDLPETINILDHHGNLLSVGGSFYFTQEEILEITLGDKWLDKKVNFK